jgi:hypothetical protein
MKFGKKPIQLIGKNAEPIHARYNYKYVDKAVSRAMKLPDRFVQLWDTQSGREIGTVTKTRKTITVSFQ